MPGYIMKVLEKYQHPLPVKPQHSPFKLAPYVSLRKNERQYGPSPDLSPTLDASNTTWIQQIVGSLLHYGRAIDHTILPALNNISASQAKPTITIKSQCHHLLDYCATYPDVVLCFQASDMVITIDSDAAYLVEPGAKIMLLVISNSTPIVHLTQMSMQLSSLNAKSFAMLLHPQLKLKLQVFFIMPNEPFLSIICSTK